MDKTETGQNIKDFIVFYDTAYKTKFDHPPNIQGGRDAGQLKRMFRRYPALPFEAFQKLLQIYLGDDSDYNAKNNWSLSLFVKQLEFYMKDHLDRRIGSNNLWE